MYLGDSTIANAVSRRALLYLLCFWSGDHQVVEKPHCKMVYKQHVRKSGSAISKAVKKKVRERSLAAAAAALREHAVPAHRVLFLLHIACPAFFRAGVPRLCDSLAYVTF